MFTYKLYIRYRGHIEEKYETANSEQDAEKQALRYFHNGSIVKTVFLR